MVLSCLKIKKKYTNKYIVMKIFVFDNVVPLKDFLLSLKNIRKIKRIKTDERDKKERAKWK